MIIERIAFQGIRNLSLGQVSLGNINLFIGSNGQGKTSFLETIHFALTLKSFRYKTSFNDLLSYDSDDLEIKINLKIKAQEDSFHYDLYKSHEKFLIFKNDHIFKKSFQEFQKTHLPGVLYIAPMSMVHFFSDTKVRRTFLESLILLLRPEKKYSFKRYYHLVKIKKILLEQGNYIHGSSLDKELIKESINYESLFNSFILDLNPGIRSLFSNLFPSLENVSLRRAVDDLWKDSLNIEEKFFKLSKEELQEKRNKTPLPHKHDTQFFLKEFKAISFCSQGQLKGLFYSLIFSFLDLYYGSFKHYPLVLIDDISGEFDLVRWKSVKAQMQQRCGQFFITTANEGFENIFQDEVTKFWVNKGLVCEYHS